MELIPVRCPSCGGEINIPQDKKVVFCLHCGNKFQIHENQVSNANLNDWEYKKIEYYASAGQVRLEDYRTNAPDSDDRAKHILKLWVLNQHQIKNWFSEYSAQGWELTEPLDSGCLIVKQINRPFLGRLFEAFFRTPYETWYISGWVVNVKRITHPIP